MVSKQEILGEEILKRIHVHDADRGGIFTLTTGSMGSAKTSVMCSFTDYTTSNFPDEKVFWSECYKSPLQVFKIQAPYEFFIKNDIHATFRDRNNKRMPIEQPYKTFTDFEDLYNQAKPGYVTIPFFGNRLYWMGFIDYLRNVGEWVHVYIDEIAEVCPAYAHGDLWKYIGEWSKEVLKDIRKDLINLHGNTQSINNVDHRIMNYVMVNIFLPGARSFKHSRITQSAIDNLRRDPINGNSAYLDAGGEFGVTQFKDIYKPNTVHHIDVICNGGGESHRIPSFITSRYKTDKNSNN